MHGKLPSGAISNKNLVKMTTFRFCKLLNIFACGMQRVDAARTAMLDIVHEITPWHYELLVSIYMYVNSNRIQAVRRDAMYKVHIQ